MPDSTRRTLERRIGDWRALHGADKEVFFPQRHDPGRQGLSDFTVADKLGVTIVGQAFPHRLYHFRLAYSGWEDASVILGGESFSAFSEGLQDALWKLGGARRYDELSRHYGMTATRNNTGVAHENGSIESPNGHLKRRLDQALLQRGGRDFDDLDAYRRFVALVCDRHNARRRGLIATEREALKDLPKRRTTDFTTLTASVTRNSTISIDRVLYTVQPRLIGRKLEVHLFDDRLECFLGPTPAVTLPRHRADRAHRGRAIDYRHVIGALRKKPQALRHLIYRDELFPRAAYARAWQALDAALPARQACRVMVGLLELAATGACEAALADRLDAILDAGQTPDLSLLQDQFAPKIPQVVDVVIPPPDLAAYNHLLPARACS